MGEHAPHLAAVSRCYRSRVWSVALPKSLCKFQDDLYQRRGIEPVPKNHSEPNVWKGALAGLVEGLGESGWSSMKAGALCLDLRRGRPSTHFRSMLTR